MDFLIPPQDNHPIKIAIILHFLHWKIWDMTIFKYINVGKQ